MSNHSTFDCRLVLNKDYSTPCLSLLSYYCKTYFPSCACVMPPIKPCKRITCRKPGFAIGKRRTASALNGLTLFISSTTTDRPVQVLHQHPSASRVLKLVRAEKEVFALFTFHHKLNRGNCPVGVTTDTGRGSIRHTKYSRPAAHRHTEKKQKKQTFTLPFCRENMLYGTLYKCSSKSCLFYNLLHRF